MKVLVTGGNGFVGREIVRQLREEEKYKVFSTDITKGKEVEYLDVTKLSQVISYLKKKKFQREDGIIHLAARVGGKPSLVDPWSYYYVNILGTLNILEAMKTLGVRYLVFPSSWSTYGSKIKLPITEETQQHPENPYGRSKVICESLIESYSKRYNVKAVILRPTMIYGPGQKEKNVMQQLVDAMASGTKFEIYGSGKHTREFLHVRDAARVFRKSLEIVKEVENYEVFVLGTEKPIRIVDLAKLAKKISDFPLAFKRSSTWAFSQRSDLSKLKKVFKIDTKDFISVEEGLRECLKRRMES